LGVLAPALLVTGAFQIRPYGDVLCPSRMRIRRIKCLWFALPSYLPAP